MLLRHRYRLTWGDAEVDFHSSKVMFHINTQHAEWNTQTSFADCSRSADDGITPVLCYS